MQFNLDESIRKIYKAFNGLDRMPKAVIKHGTQIFLLVFALGTLLVVLNRTSLSYNYYNEYLAATLFRTSFIIFAEAVIGGLILDFVFKKQE